MVIVVPGVLAAAAAAEMCAALDDAVWIDRAAAAGPRSAAVACDRQLDGRDPLAADLADHVLAALRVCPLFVAAALPLRIAPPLFGRLDAGGGSPALHVDPAVRMRRGSDVRVRADIAATLFLSEPEEYDGGALVVEDGLEPREVRLPAGDLLVHPASGLRRTTSVTRGTRFVASIWVQSMVRDADARRTLLDLDRSVQELAAELPGDTPAIVRLTGIYHDLLRRWAEV